MKHLLVDISGHGFGHLAQVAPTLNALGLREIDIHVTLRTSLPENLLRSKISLQFDYVRMELDKGMIMNDAIGVNQQASYNWYQQFHDKYEQKLSEQTQLLETLKPDLLFADIPYISLDAAHFLGIPSIALCSLNWADIFYSYCKHQAKSEIIYKQILAAYNKADSFLQPMPSMDMPEVTNGKAIGPISLHGNRHRLAAYTQSTDREKNREKFVLVSLGGIDTQLAIEILPVIENVNWIVPNTMTSTRKDILPQSIFQIPYIDLVSSVDLILTKTGYGTMVEAVTHQIPVLCIERPDWPEESNLFAWCKKHGYFESVTRDQLTQKVFPQRVKTLLATSWDKPAIKANGAQQAADILYQYLV